jgi:hypothetical protein
MKYLSLAALTLLTLAACAPAVPSDTGSATSSRGMEISTSSANSQSAAVSSAPGMRFFGSEMLGFNMQLPDTIYVSDSLSSVRMTVFEPIDQHVTYIAPQQWQKQGDTAPRQTTVADLTAKQRPDDYIPFWEIRFKRVEGGIEEAVAKTFGPGCLMGEKTPIPGTTDYRFSLQGMETTDGSISCGAAMANAVIFHSPVLRSMIYWNLGQDVRFISDAQGTTVYDPQMLESFRFVD